MKQITCGKLALHWLTPATLVSEAELEQGVHPSEWREAQNWQAKTRRDEFLRSRWLLRRLTGYQGILGKTPAGAPVWPPASVGSLTHKSGFIGLALLPSSDWLSIGIDAEDPARMQLAFAPRLCLPAEEALLRKLADGDLEHQRFLLTVLFSFKEALFKTLFPLGEIMFYCHDAEITGLDQQSGQITVCLRRDVAPVAPTGLVLTGSYRSLDSDGRTFVLTCIGIERTVSGGTGRDSCG